jgi:hypothetical protein
LAQCLKVALGVDVFTNLGWELIEPPFWAA